MAEAEAQQQQQQPAQDQDQVASNPTFVSADDDDEYVEEVQAPAGAQREPLNLEELPELVYLQTTRSWISKADVGKKIRERYLRIMKALGTQALRGSTVKQKLDDYAIAASKASAGRLIERHAKAWGPALRDARKAARVEMEKVETAREVFERDEDLKDVGRLEDRATERWEKAVRGCETAAALVKELKDVLSRDE